MERTKPTEADLHKLLEQQLPSTIETIEEELSVLNELGTSPTDLRNSVPDLNLRQRLIQRKGMLLKIEIVVRAGLPIDMATREDTGSVLETARACLDAVDAIRKLLRKADALDLGSIIRKRLGKELE